MVVDIRKNISFKGLLLIALFLASFYQSTNFSDPFIIPKHFFLVFVGIFSLLGPLHTYLLNKKTLVYHITFIDLGLYLLFIYTSINYIVFSGNPLLEVQWINFLVFVVIYTLYKPLFISSLVYSGTRFSQTLVIGLMLIAILQSSYGLGQFFKLFKSLNPDFVVTGAFGNPGPYANFLVALFPFSFVYALFSKNKAFKILGSLTSMVIIIVLPLTMARTAWIAIAVVIVYILIHINIFAKLWNKYFSTLKNKLLLILVIVIGLLLAAYALSSLKKDSASGRIFIWKVSAEMIKDKPIFGHGYARYAVAHSTYQANYFKENPTDWKNAYLADDIEYAFNEYVQLAAEIGVVGLLIFLFIPFMVYRNKKINIPNNPTLIITLAAEGAILGILVCSLFSYPLHDVSVMAVFILSLAILSANRSKELWAFNVKLGWQKIMVLFTLVLAFFFLKFEQERFKAEKEWLRAFTLVRQKSYISAQKKYTAIQVDLLYNRYFRFNYGAELSVMGQYQKSILVLESAKYIINDSDYYIYLGNSYEGKGDLQKAFDCFEQASFIMPVKFYPKYRMVKLHQKLGHYFEAKKLAKAILDMPVKVESDIVKGIRKDMRDFLDH